MANFIITEKQKNTLDEEISVMVDPRETNNDLNAAFKKEQMNVRNSGVNPDNITYTIHDPKVESIIKTKKQIQEDAAKKARSIKNKRLKELKESSKVYKVKDLIINK